MPRVKMLSTLRTAAGMVTSYTCHTKRYSVSSVLASHSPWWLNHIAAHTSSTLVTI